jgi:RNA-directed DNA polymerase
MSAGAYRCDLLPRQLPTRLRYGNSARVLGQIRNYALRRVALLLSKTGKRRRAWDWGMRQVLRSPDHLGLISLDGAVIPPRPFRDWRAERRR